MDEARVAEAVERIVREAVGSGCKCRKMTLEKAKRLAAAVQAEATRIGVKAVVAVSDGAGNPIYAESQDGAYIASWDIAVKKAFTVVSLKMPTSALAKLAAPGGALYGVQFTNDGKIVVFGGGEPLEANGKVVGGLGVSGGSAEQDTALAAFGKEKFKEIMETC